jgi:polyisoprenoid-binding protein YceI
MRNFLFVIIAFTVFAFSPAGDKIYMAKNGHVEFSSRTPLEEIFAQTDQAVSIIKTGNGDFDIAILHKSFKFKNSLMEEHYNENYMESDKFPKAVFKGKITNLSEINFEKDGDYKAVIEGNMTIHGVTKPVKINGLFKVKGDKVNGTAKFSIVPQDYDVKIPDLVKEKIAKEISVSVVVDYSPFSK